MIYVEVINLAVLILTLLAVRKYTLDTNRLLKIEAERRLVETDLEISKYDLNLEISNTEYRHDGNTGELNLILILDNNGGPVKDVRILTQKEVEYIDHDRKKWWYPTLGKLILRYMPEREEAKNIPLQHFRFTALYTNKFNQKRTKSFVVKVHLNEIGKSFIREIETIDGHYEDHLDNIGRYFPQPDYLIDSKKKKLLQKNE